MKPSAVSVAVDLVIFTVREGSLQVLLIERGVLEQAHTCLISAPGGCATKWIEEFGYVTIPTLALTGFVLCTAFLLLALFDPWDEDVTDDETAG